MGATYRFSWLKPSGWTRLGVVGAVGVVFATPMLWSVGVFGGGDDALRQGLVFLMSGLWFFIGIGYATGWAIRGFLTRVKGDAEDEEGERDGPPARAGAGPAHRPAAH